MAAIATLEGQTGARYVPLDRLLRAPLAFAGAEVVVAGYGGGPWLDSAPQTFRLTPGWPPGPDRAFHLTLDLAGFSAARKRSLELATRGPEGGGFLATGVVKGTTLRPDCPCEPPFHLVPDRWLGLGPFPKPVAKDFEELLHPDARRAPGPPAGFRNAPWVELARCLHCEAPMRPEPPACPYCRRRVDSFPAKRQTSLKDCSAGLREALRRGDEGAAAAEAALAGFVFASRKNRWLRVERGQPLARIVPEWWARARSFVPEFINEGGSELIVATSEPEPETFEALARWTGFKIVVWLALASEVEEAVGWLFSPSSAQGSGRRPGPGSRRVASRPRPA